MEDPLDTDPVSAWARPADAIPPEELEAPVPTWERLVSERVVQLDSARRFARRLRAVPRSGLAAIREQVDQLHAELDLVRREVAEIRAESGAPVLLDAALTHVDGAKAIPFRGKYVAIHAEHGVIAAADTLAEVFAEVERLAVAPVVYDFVSP